MNDVNGLYFGTSLSIMVVALVTVPRGITAQTTVGVTMPDYDF